MRGFLLLLLTFFWLNLFSQTLDSTNLPIVLINTNGKTILNTPRIIVDLKIIDHLVYDTNYITDTLHYNFNGKASIEIRGSSSSMFPKKPYSFETKDTDTVTVNAPLLGMPADNDWVLYASYNDKSMLRNYLSMQLTNEMGTYAPRTRFCELVINNDYLGVYLIMEKIKQGKNRVDIAKLDSNDLAGDSITGGYIVKIDKFTGDNTQAWVSSIGLANNGTSLCYQYHYPEYTDMQKAQRTYIKNYVDAFESIMKSKTYNDSVIGYISVIDTLSFVNHVIISELSRNLDAYRLSTFLNKQKESKGGKLRAGPIWDYDLAFGMPNYCNAWSYIGWEIETTTDCGWSNPVWFTKLFRDVKFHNMMVRHWQKYRKTVLTYSHIEHLIDSAALLLRDPQSRNFQRWPILGAYVWPNYYIGTTYEQEITYMKNWIQQRLLWMDDNLKLLPDTAKPYVPPIDTTPKPNSIISGIDGCNIYPNPFTNQVNIEVNGESEFTVEISDLTGKIINHLSARSGNVVWNGKNSSGEEAPAGIYIIRIMTGDKIVPMKIIKQ